MSINIEMLPVFSYLTQPLATINCINFMTLITRFKYIFNNEIINYMYVTIYKGPIIKLGKNRVYAYDFIMN